MQPSPHSQALPAQQAMTRETPIINRNPSQHDRRNVSQSQPQIPAQLTGSHQYLNPYSFQLFYGNPAISATLLAAHAQAQYAAAIAAATGGRAHPLVMPWLKANHQAQGESSDLQLASKQQALFAALYGAKPLEESANNPSLFRVDTMSLPSLPSSPALHSLSPNPEKTSSRSLKNERLQQKIQSPKETLARKLSNSSSSSPRPSTEAPKSLSSSLSSCEQSHDLSRNDFPLHNAPKYPPLSEHEAILQNRFKEESWRSKYMGNSNRRSDGAIQTKSSDKSWSFDPHVSQSITRTPLGMIDPATYLATHGAHFIRDEARQNGFIESNLREPSLKAISMHSRMKDSSNSSTGASSSVNVKLWRQPVKNELQSHDQSPKHFAVKENSADFIGTSSCVTTSNLLSHENKPSVVNIHSLKYSPLSNRVPSSTLANPKSNPDKNVIVKTSSLIKKEDVKYISDPPSHRQKSPTPEKLGPVMADGSRARVLSPTSLNSLYRFPVPSFKSQASEENSRNQKTIISTEDYKVTQVLGNRETPIDVQQSIPNHLVYPKHTSSLHKNEATDLTVSPQELASPVYSENKSARKRAVEEDACVIDRKLRVKSQCPNSPSNSSGTSLPETIQRSISSVYASSTDPHLRGLIGAGMFDISSSSIMWGDSSKISNECPGAPTKVALKGALLAVTEDDFQKVISKASPTNEFQSQLSTTETTTVSAITSTDNTKELQSTSLQSDAKVNVSMSIANKITASYSVSSSDQGNSSMFSGASEQINADPTDAFSQILEKSPLSKVSIQEAKPKPSSCHKLKKAWIKRSCQSDDAASKFVEASVTQANLTDSLLKFDQKTSESVSDDDPKKLKKRNFKIDKEKPLVEAAKKKRKSKDKDYKIKKSESGFDSTEESASRLFQSTPDEEGLLESFVHTKSNSKMFLMGRLATEKKDGSEETSDGDDGDGSKVKKKHKKHKTPPAMPLGDNGLPISVLHNRKEQARLKKSGNSFMQDAPCHELASIPGISLPSTPAGASSLPKCRECRSAKRKENSAIFCRFYGFRKLVFVGGQLHSAGFCDPEDSEVSDLSLWLPAFHKGTDRGKIKTERPLMELETCRYIMKHIGKKFCEVVQEERDALLNAEKNAKVSWKRPVPGVREMCDACETTLFNLHWVCQKCGFGICVDCHQTRQGMSKEEMEAYDNDKSNLYRWLKCGKGKHHHPLHLVPTQIIPSTCLFDLCELAHEVRSNWNITSQCQCKKVSTATSSFGTSRSADPTPLLKNHCSGETLSHSSGRSSIKSESKLNSVPRLKTFDCENSSSPLDWLASIALREQRKTSPSPSNTTSADEKNNKTLEKTLPLSKNSNSFSSNSAAPRSWLCNGQLLQLTDSTSSVNIDTFQLHWFYGMPVMASGASSNLNRELWKPETFSAEHGNQPTGSALINCRKGSIITNALIRDFWSGFEKIDNRLRDERTGEKMILKLKDWPTTDDFIDTMPDKFDDLMRALPLAQYTARDGKFNMAAHLPDFFVRPDLGPKMYIAYGWVTERDWNQGTTNLHLDISDACNLMVYVGVPEDEPPEALETLINIIREGDVDEAQVERALTEKPGALWHIFKAADTDKIRKLILKVKAEKGIEVSDDHDPIHDQQIYLDRPLRRRLKDEYNVEGYPLVQCEGDSVFIPAGAPHQVFNLHSCIKVAEDFVSPEHVDKCFKLTDEFRHLSTTHSNHEDKLQLKNIIYHTIKEVVSSFCWHEGNLSKPGQIT